MHNPSVGRTPTIEKKRRSGRGNRKKKFTETEITFLLGTIEQNLPIGPQEWERVSTEYIKEFSDMDRDRESLRRKFGQLVNSKVPTGDPLCPPDVQWAKQITRSIESKADAGMATRSDLGIEAGELSYDEDGSFIIDTPNDETEDQVDVENNQQEAARKESNTVKKANQEVTTRPPFIALRISPSDSTQDAMNNYIQFMMKNHDGRLSKQNAESTTTSAR